MTSVYLSKEVELLGLLGKFSFISRTKTSVENLVRYSLTSVEWVHTLITNDHKRISLTVGPRKSKNFNL